MSIKNKNFAFKSPTANDGDTFKYCNFSQLNPDTEILKDNQNLTFIECNLINCIVPPDSKVVSCNTCKKEFCSNARPDLVSKGLKVCDEDCKHRVSEQKQWVNIDEDEMIEHKKSNQKSLNSAPNTRVIKEDDEFGVTRQTYQKQVYVYKNKNLGRIKYN